ncbi:MAG: helix-turn-helix domain-containing protein, partial [Gemmatimonadota bacterium]
TYRCHPGGAIAKHRVLPHGGISLCLRHAGGEDEGSPSEVILLGPVHHARAYEPKVGEVLRGVEVCPEWARSLLRVAPEEHVDRIRSWKEATGRGDLDTLPRRSSDATAGFRLLLGWLEARVQGLGQDSSARIAHAGLRRLRSSPEGSVSVVAASLGLSTRHLRRIITGLIGASPKHLQRLARLNRVVMEADGLKDPSWAGLAVRHGFFDQAHLIREVRALTTVTPTTLHAERRAQPVPFFQSSSPFSS